MEQWRRLDPARKGAILMVVSQMCFGLRNFVFFKLNRASVGEVSFILPIVFMGTSLLLLISARGMWKHQKWASNLFLLPSLMILVGMMLIAKRTWAIHWSLFPCWVIELSTLLGSLVQITKVPKEDWQENKVKGWRKLGQLQNWVFLFWLICQVEMWLVVGGLRPGAQFAPRYFHKVEQLIPKQDYFTDENGVMRLSSIGVEAASQGTYQGKELGTYHRDLPYSASTYSLYEDMIAARKGLHENAFTRMLDSLAGLSDSLLSAVDSAYLSFRDFPINEEGFRSIPFRQFDQRKRKTVLLIGDSFTFGWSARPWTGSFADELSAMGYIVYNAGITATDPAQYEAVARKYIPLLKPDVVVVNVFMGNDIMNYPREAGPGRMAYFPANAGVMMAAPHGEYFEDAEVAYEHYLKEYFIPEDQGWVGNLCTHTIIGTIAWKVAQKLGLLDGLNLQPNVDYHSRTKKNYREQPYTEEYIQGLVEVAEKEGSKWLIGIIPDIKDPQPDLPKDYPLLFESLPFELPEMVRDDFNPSEEHFNLQGHQKYAQFLHEKIQGLK